MTLQDRKTLRREIIPGKLEYHSFCGEQWLYYYVGIDKYHFDIYFGGFFSCTLYLGNPPKCVKNNILHELKKDEYDLIIPGVITGFEQQKSRLPFFKYRIIIK